MNGDNHDAGGFQCGAVYLLTAAGDCYRCKKPTPMHALMALPPFSYFGPEDERDEVMDEGGCMLQDIELMPVALAARIRVLSADNWRRDHSQTARATYWMNHCASCGAKQGDFFVHGANGPFWPTTDAEGDAIEAEKIGGPIRFLGTSTSYSGAMAAWRDRRHGVVREPVVVKPRSTRKKAT